jgi:uncharacterized protein YycO
MNIQTTNSQADLIKPNKSIYTPLNIIIFTLKCLVFVAILTSPLFLWIVVFGLFRLFVMGRGRFYDKPIPDISLLKKGDIILTGSNSVNHSWYIQASNVLTRKLKHRFWTHAAIYAGDGNVWEALPGKDKGIVLNAYADYAARGQIVRVLRHKYVHDESLGEQVVRYCQNHKGSAYGGPGIVFYALSTLIPISFNWLFDDCIMDRICGLDEAYFCSELVVDAYASTDNSVSPFDGWRVKPSDFISNPLLEKVE